MSYRWWSCCRTNTGRRRRINEDAYLALHDIGLWLIADGMGGHARGDVASHIVVESFSGLGKPHSMEEFAQQVSHRRCPLRASVVQPACSSTLSMRVRSPGLSTTRTTGRPSAPAGRRRTATSALK